METGSGKTPIAVLRIMSELETCSPDKLIWFLAPTVALCLQQHEVIASQLPAVKTRTLTGLDKVELWTEQIIWDAVLKDVRVVVSTHAVLADALSHGFVKMSQLALLIFDEAHHCMRRHPANKIMQDFYHPALSNSGIDAVPRTLGLTASPAVRSNTLEMITLESNLHAVCKTPRMHRQELLTYTHRPQLCRIWFAPLVPDGLGDGSQMLGPLLHALRTLNIENDPYVKKLRKSPFEAKELQNVLSTGKTYCNEQLRRFAERSGHIFEELGGWGADYFIQASIEQIKASVNELSAMANWDYDEKIYLAEVLSQIPMPNLQVDFAAGDHFPMSSKLESLIAFLRHENEVEFSGLIFAKRRATVNILAKVLSIYPGTKDRFRCAAYVGWSSGNSKDVIGELLSMDMQRDTLAEFRSGSKNLIVATDVLEEGIDISACSMVICYDKPPNLKSFVQRRGRARQRQSTYAIMFPTDDESPYLNQWQELEKAMIEAYQDDERRLREASELENIDEDVKERLAVESTCALLTEDSATGHLHHFCAVLPQQPYVDNRPVFSFENNSEGLVKGTVILPNCVHPKVRRTRGQRWWRTERAAMKETAFQAYKSLYEFGLVNDNLLPLTKKPELGIHDFESLPSMVDASEQYDPWVDLAYSWATPNIHQSRITVRQNGFAGSSRLSMILTGPTILPDLEPMTLYWDSETTFTLSFEPAQQAPMVTPESVEYMRRITALYIQATKSKINNMGNDFVALFGPDLSPDQLGSWLETNGGNHTALEAYTNGSSSPVLMGIVRDQGRYNEPLIFRRWVVSEENQNPSALELECHRLPRRRNLLHRQTLANRQQFDGADDEALEPTAKVRIVSANQCTIDKLPFASAIFGLFISVIVDRLEVLLVAARLRETILKPIGFASIDHVITAITAPSAQGLTNYQRYEFLGDSVLKFTVSCQLYFQHPNWPEGYLSENRNVIVKNPRLARAALDLGLDAFIIERMFTPRKWAAPLISERMAQKASRRKMSRKVLADVVEALIGAAYMDGGHPKAQACIRRFLPEMKLQSLDIQTPHKDPNPPPLHYTTNERLKDHIGYSFTDKSLLVEALTHPSCEYDAHSQSYQRLEFLGDAVLDMVVVTAIFQHPAEVSPGDMTLIKHALVNANLLAFLCMEISIPETRTDVEQVPDGRFAIKSGEDYLQLWRFMRCQGLELKKGRDATLQRHHALRDEIISSLEHADFYPWQALARLGADKFFSDIVESVLGAIFVDSGGDLAVCEMFVERIGLLPYLRRVLSQGINMAHPKNMADRLSKGEVFFKVQRIQHDSNNASYQCVVTLNEAVIVHIEGCLTAEDAEVTASNEAVRILMEMNQQNGNAP
ncbi:hypothetical protein ASPWEDRAFT_622733 [Aspergillus wentii DTO 134E9]|uniref:Dicer-like protein 2 n=1 Tax=Aspergillus wentii DTO 134E9 TaxID=1073089 RepID=A0A1L9REV9_ASPWE|nr:uncharacterized protein ASPWEDRAFT_622733 [Aspergillus wentii DTO 134E9]OJJ33462.1 hypothetical protein ASPWEDRAFT_622733 [Aspergillus wentii DTO 134E9]